MIMFLLTRQKLRLVGGKYKEIGVQRDVARNVEQVDTCRRQPEIEKLSSYSSSGETAAGSEIPWNTARRLSQLKSACLAVGLRRIFPIVRMASAAAEPFPHRRFTETMPVMRQTLAAAKPLGRHNKDTDGVAIESRTSGTSQ
jgi:hypothetical protein